MPCTPGAHWATFALVLALAGRLSGESLGVDLVAVHRDPQDLIATLRNLGLGRHEVPIDVITAPGLPKQVTVILVRADLDAARQAVGHAMQAWWCHDVEGNTIYRRDLRLPIGPLSTRTYTSNIIQRPDREQLVHQVMAPWLGAAGCGVALDASSGTWAGTLDRDGHQRLVEVLDLLERNQPACPSLIPHPGDVMPAAMLTHPLRSDSWAALATALAERLHISIALAANLPPAPAVIDLPAGTLASLGEQLNTLHLRHTWIHGVWCWGLDAPLPRQHPAQARRLALLPAIALHDETSFAFFATMLKRADPAWSTPGACLLQPDPGFLLAGNDVIRLHQAWDLLNRAERDGLDRMMTTSEASP